MKIKIDGRFFDFFSNISVNYSLDSVASTFSLSAQFDPQNEEHKKIFLPLAYKNFQLFTDEDELLLTGYLVSSQMGSSNANELQNLSGYSRPGFLEDCTIPYSLYPLERLNVSLDDLAKIILSPFEFGYVADASVRNDMQLEYAKTVAGPSETIKNFLAKLASQRNIVLGHTVEGDLLFFRPDPKAKPKETFNASNTLRMSLNVNGQKVFSDITVIRQPSKNNPSLTPVDTAKNALTLKNRSIVKVLTSGTETATKKAADNARSEQLKNIKLTVEVPRIITNIKCGDIVEVQNERVYLFNKAKFMVSNMTVNEDNQSQKTTLRLVLPETFTGESPVNIFST